MDKEVYNTNKIVTPFGEKHIIYADYTASGKPYKPIEDWLIANIYPYYANTHSNATLGTIMAKYIQQSRDIIRKNLGANEDDAIIFTGHGCSSAVVHFIHLVDCKSCHRAVVFITDYEHNSNFLPWKMRNVDLVIVPTLKCGIIDLKEFKKLLDKHCKGKKDTFKIVSFSGGSNITGIVQPIDIICKLGHEYGCIVAFDMAAVAPYIEIDMHKDDKGGNYIDALFISPHKYLGGPGTPGLLVVNKRCVRNHEPFLPSGGTVRYTSDSVNIYSSNLEVRESGGTPNILGIIRCGLVFQLKGKNQSFIKKREKIVAKYVYKELSKIKEIQLVNCPETSDFVPIFSFMIPGVHYNFVVVLLNDLFGMQTRGGVSCSGLYAKKVCCLDDRKEQCIVNSILHGKGVPGEYGWCRVSFHYTMPDFVIDYMINAIQYVSENYQKYLKKYEYLPKDNKWVYISNKKRMVDSLKLDLDIDNSMYDRKSFTPSVAKTAFANLK